MTSSPAISGITEVVDLRWVSAWTLLNDDTSWKKPDDKDTYISKHGLRNAEDMEYLSDTEIDELAEKMTTVPFRKIKKLRNE